MKINGCHFGPLVATFLSSSDLTENWSLFKIVLSISLTRPSPDTSISGFKFKACQTPQSFMVLDSWSRKTLSGTSLYTVYEVWRHRQHVHYTEKCTRARFTALPIASKIDLQIFHGFLSSIPSCTLATAQQWWSCNPIIVQPPQTCEHFHLGKSVAHTTTIPAETHFAGLPLTYCHWTWTGRNENLDARRKAMTMC